MRKNDRDSTEKLDVALRLFMAALETRGKMAIFRRRRSNVRTSTMIIKKMRMPYLAIIGHPFDSRCASMRERNRESGAGRMRRGPPDVCVVSGA